MFFGKDILIRTWIIAYENSFSTNLSKKQIITKRENMVLKLGFYLTWRSNYKRERVVQIKPNIGAKTEPSKGKKKPILILEVNLTLKHLVIMMLIIFYV
jgi:hypothetical protein